MFPPLDQAEQEYKDQGTWYDVNSERYHGERITEDYEMQQPKIRSLKVMRLFSMSLGLTTMIEAIAKDNTINNRYSDFEHLKKLRDRIDKLMGDWKSTSDHSATKSKEVHDITKLYEGYALAVLTRGYDLTPVETFRIANPMSEKGYTQVLHLRLSVKQFYLIKAAAKHEGITVADYMRQMITMDVGSIFNDHV